MPLEATAMLRLAPIVLLLATCGASRTYSRKLLHVYNTTAVDPSTYLDLGAAKQFTVLANTKIANKGATTVGGYLGVSPGGEGKSDESDVTGDTMDGKNSIYYSALPSDHGHAIDGVTEDALDDAKLAYQSATGRDADGVVNIDDDELVDNGDIGGLTFYPGHYNTTGPLNVSKTFYLRGDGVFIFQTTAMFLMGPGSKMILQDGARASNVFWVIGTTASFDANSDAVGTFITQGLITVGSGTSVTGRLFAIGEDAEIHLENSIVVFPESSSRVELLTAEFFTALAYATITNTGPTRVGGLIGVSPGSSITGFSYITYSALPVPKGRAASTPEFGSPDARTAKADLTTAYLDAAGREDEVNKIVVVNIGGQTFTPGLYKTTGALQVTGQDLYLSGNGVFIFQLATDLLVTEGRKMILQDGAQACNVFWQIGRLAQFMAGSDSVGTFMAYAKIDALTGATIDGRLFSLNEAVNLDANVVNFPCTHPAE
uniref:Ice-binding protein isoform 7 n=1 Tax=Chlamydomonas sp. ICE-MDV TaxID=1983280 RepID=A0A1W6JGI5_9CHLO|nr:ice-binding protein isoform 7 [Chlamydomonas sp. ICE-MDV]